MLSSYFDIQSKSSSSLPGDPRQPPPPPQQHQLFGKKKQSRAKGAASAAAAAATAKKREPRPTEAATTSVHTKFVPLPPECNVPKPAEVPSQAWQALSGSGVSREDDMAEFRADWTTFSETAMETATEWDEEEAAGDELDDMSEPDYEPESLDPLGSCTPGGGGGGEGGGGAAASLSSSLEEDTRSRDAARSLHAFFSGRRLGQRTSSAASQMYSGPQLCYEDEDFD